MLRASDNNGCVTLRLRDIAAEGVLLLGGARAILLQLANPGVGIGVARHSDFSSDPLRRLRGTLSYIYLVVYGTGAERAEVVAHVERTHHPVHGNDPRASYDANDPQLQLWVAATLYESAITVYERAIGPLDAASSAAVYRDYAVLGTALRVPESAWPVDRAAFDRYWVDATGEFRVSEEALDVSRRLLRPTGAPLWLRAAMPLVRLITTGLLSPELRELYELPWSDRRQHRFNRALRLISAVNRRLPKRIRHWPKHHYLAQFRRDRIREERAPAQH